jgi:hypothetical protein
MSLDDLISFGAMLIGVGTLFMIWRSTERIARSDRPRDKR